jgi:hypothetical protein
VILGLSEGNLQKLREGDPIFIHKAELGLREDVLILYGKTEQDIVETLEKHSPGTKQRFGIK